MVYAHTYTTCTETSARMKTIKEWNPKKHSNNTTILLHHQIFCYFSNQALCCLSHEVSLMQLYCVLVLLLDTILFANYTQKLFSPNNRIVQHCTIVGSSLRNSLRIGGQIDGDIYKISYPCMQSQNSIVQLCTIYTEAHCIREEDAWVYRWGYKFIYVYTFIVVVMQCCLLLSQ